MQINGTDMQNMHQYRYQGGGANQGMRDMMQMLSAEDRENIKTQIQSLSPEDRQSFVSQIQQTDYSGMSSEELNSYLLDLLSGYTTTQESGSASEEGFSTYA